MKFAINIVCVVLAISTWSIAVDRVATPTSKPSSQPASPAIRCEREGDAIQSTASPTGVVLDVTSRIGIGGATITRTADAWPEKIVLRFHLKADEQISLTSGGKTLNVSSFRHDGATSILSLREENKETQLDSRSPLWFEVTSCDADGKPLQTSPPAGGWFELTVPKAFLVDQDKVLSVKWIDYFRG